MVQMTRLVYVAVLMALISAPTVMAQEPGTVKWVFSPPNTHEMDSSPVIARDGTIIVADRYRYVWALNPDGSLKWQFQAHGFTGQSRMV